MVFFDSFQFAPIVQHKKIQRNNLKKKQNFQKIHFLRDSKSKILINFELILAYKKLGNAITVFWNTIPSFGILFPVLGVLFLG